MFYEPILKLRQLCPYTFDDVTRGGEFIDLLCEAKQVVARIDRDGFREAVFPEIPFTFQLAVDGVTPIALFFGMQKKFSTSFKRLRNVIWIKVCIRRHVKFKVVFALTAYPLF